MVFAICAAVSVARGLSDRRDRAAWFVLASGLEFYALSPLLAAVTHSDSPPGFPAAPDLLAWILYPCGLLAIGLLARAQRSRARADLWLDGESGGLAVASVGVVIIFDLGIDPLASLAGLPGGTYDDDLVTDMHGDIAVYVPVPHPPRTGRVQPKVIPAADLAVTVHRGTYSDLDITYGALGMWVVQHALTIAGSVRETYAVGPQDTFDETEWITEISWPVAMAGRP